jgi:hypothetical protein
MPSLEGSPRRSGELTAADMGWKHRQNRHISCSASVAGVGVHFVDDEVALAYETLTPVVLGAFGASVRPVTKMQARSTKGLPPICAKIVPHRPPIVIASRPLAARQPRGPSIKISPPSPLTTQGIKRQSHPKRPSTQQIL